MSKKVKAEMHVEADPLPPPPELVPAGEAGEESAVAAAGEDGDDAFDALQLIWDCSCKMVGLMDLEIRPDIPQVLARFVLANRAAPAEAALMQVKLELKIDLFPDEYSRLAHLAVDLFRKAVLGLYDIGRQDIETELQRMKAAEPQPQRALRDEERTMRGANHGLMRQSAFGKAMSGKTD